MTDWDVLLGHVFREANICADGAVGNESLVYWDNPPQDMRNVLLTGAMEVEYYRD